MSTKFPLQVDKVDLDSHKSALVAAVEADGDPGPFLAALVGWLDDEVRAAVGAAPTKQMLLPY